MRKNPLFGMLLVLGTSLAPLHGAAADGFGSVPCAAETSMRKDWFMLTGDLSAIYGAVPDGICPQLEQSTTVAATVEISTEALEALAAVSTGAAVVEVSSETGKLSDYFTVETPALQNAGQTKLAGLQFQLQYRVNRLEEMVNRMADDQVVTSDELSGLKDALKFEYDYSWSFANKELAFYGLNIPEDERVATYWKLALIPDGQFSADDKKESIKRFFVNLTGKDVKVKMGIVDKLGLTFMGSVVAAILIILL